jgi:hypothetical protein
MKAAEDVKGKVAEGGRKGAELVNEQRGNAAGALETAADAVERQGEQLPKPLNEYASDVKDGLTAAADYVRKHDAGEMADDAAKTISEYPMASLLLIGAAVVGGGFLIASLVAPRDGRERSGRETSGEAAASRSLLATASSGLGPKASETATRMRDAAFNMALTKAVDYIEEMFPGFREHFAKA